MLSRSARFDLAVTEGGITSLRVDVTRGGATVLTDLPIASGVVNLDAGAAARRTITARVIDEFGTLTPRLGSDPLAPYGSEIVPSVGFRYVDGTTERLAAGVFRLTEVQAGDGTVDIRGEDRSIVVRQALFELPYVIPAGTEVVAAIIALIGSRYPGLTYISVPSSTTLPLTVYEEGRRGGDPWQAATSLAASIGQEVFFDVLGRVVIQSVPNPVGATIAYSYAPGSTSILLGSENRLSTERAKNVAVVAGEGTGAVTPVRASAEITDASNPLHPLVFGRRPEFLVDPKVTTTAQAQAAANSLLLQVAGGSELLGFRAVPHPAHEPGDVVRVVSSLLNGGQADVVLSSWSLPLDLRSEVTFSTRGRRS